MNNHEANILTHNRFNISMVLTFTDEKEVQIYKMLRSEDDFPEILKLMSVKSLNSFFAKQDGT